MTTPLDSLVLPAAIIAGQRNRASDDEAGNAIYNASTGDVIGWQQHADAAQVDAAVHAARDALDAWRARTPAARGDVLRKIAVCIETERTRLSSLQQQVSGKPPFEADTDVSDAIATFNYYADLCANAALFEAELVPLPDDPVTAERRYEAVGVAALIVPWNFPMVTTAWKIAPALAAGCTVVLKPSELTSPVEHRLVEIMMSAGVPDGVINVVNGGADVGAWLAAHPLIDKISFTGSTAVGRKVMQTAAIDMKRVTLELGGKSALIVRADADIEQAVALAIGGAFTNAGQMCSATSRIIVHDDVYRKFVAAFEVAVREMVIAPPRVDNASMGPLISNAQRMRVEALVEQGITEGACVAFRGSLDHACAEGFFMAPVVIAEPEVSNVLWREEVFGPVACVKSFRTDDEAAHRYKNALRAGLVWINTPQLIFPHVSWGGLGLSGIGRELGLAGLRSYQELRHAISLA